MTTLRNSWRNQVMSLIYIGPFLVLSSILFGNKDIPGSFQLAPIHWLLIITAFCCWIMLGVIAGIIEHRIWNKCNEWRSLILHILSGDIRLNDINKNSFLHVHNRPPVYVSYLVVYILLGTVFLCILYLITDIFFK